MADQTPATTALDHFLRGQAAYDAKQLAEGVQAFEAALRLEPTHYWSMMALGNCLGDLGQGPEDFVGAARVFTGCILKRPDHAYAYFCRAIAYTQLRHYAEALADNSQAIKLDPKYANAWTNRGVAYNELGQLDKAVADLSQAIQLDPKHANAWTNRGVTYHKLGQLDKALNDFLQAIELDSKNAHAWCSRGTTYYALGQPAKAVAEFSQAIKLNPKYALAWNSRGWTYCEMGQLDKALADCSQAIKLDPKYAHARTNRGAIYRKVGQLGKAIDDFSQAIKLDPKTVYAWYNRGNAYSELGQLDRAVADFSQAIKLDPTDLRAWHNRGIVFHKLGQLDKAVADYSQAIELVPDDPQRSHSYYMRAQANIQLGHFEQARTDYQTFLKRAPSHAGVHNGLAWLLATCPDAKLRDPERAVELARKATQLKPEVGIYWKALGVAHYRAGDWKAAIAAFNKAAQMRKGRDAVERFFLAMAHRKLGNHHEARKEYERAVRWLEKNNEEPEKDKQVAEELRRFRAEAEEVLELKKK
jgi:tetratricopeptide (TPR) repeat protein